MKKKFATVKRTAVLIVTMMSFLFFWQSGRSTHAKENVTASVMTETQGVNETYPESLIRTYDLLSDETAQVPRRIVEGNAVYELDESSIVVETNGSGSAEGADVVTFSRKVEDLSDNDLSRIEKETVIEGIPCELLSVTYKVEKQDENGMPVCYSAACQYGGLKKYSISYPTAWRMTARYDFGGILTAEEIVEIQEEMEEDEIEAGKENGNNKTAGEENGIAGKEEAPVPKAAGKGFRIQPGPETENKKKVPDFSIPLAVAAAAGAGLTVPFLIWISILTAPLYGLKEKGKYRYIGQIRLKKEKETYAAYLTKRLYARAELPVFQIRISKRVRKKAKTGMLRVHCPDEKRIMATLGRIVCFTVEGD